MKKMKKTLVIFLVFSMVASTIGITIVTVYSLIEIRNEEIQYEDIDEPNMEDYFKQLEANEEE